MSLTITVSPDVEAAIRAVARFEGRNPSDVANDALRVQYVGIDKGIVPTREGELALESPRHTLEEADARHRDKCGLADLSGLTPSQLAARAAAALDAADPAKVAEAERLGLI